MGFLGFLDAALRLFGLSDWIESLIGKWQARRQGREDQQLDDLKAQNGALQQQAEEQAAAPKTRAELEARLAQLAKGE